MAIECTCPSCVLMFLRRLAGWDWERALSDAQLSEAVDWTTAVLSGLEAEQRKRSGR